MNDFKLFVDITSSLASIIAIFSVLFSWFKNTQKPLLLSRIIVHSSPERNNYIVGFKNRKPYPVTVLSTKCYLKKQFLVEQKSNDKPVFRDILSIGNMVFEDTNHSLIGANGCTDLRFSGKTLDRNISKLLFYIETSHGYHKLKCKDILSVDIGSTEVFSPKYYKNFDSKTKAIFRYYFLKLKHFFGKKANK